MYTNNEIYLYMTDLNNIYIYIYIYIYTLCIIHIYSVLTLCKFYIKIDDLV